MPLRTINHFESDRKIGKNSLITEEKSDFASEAIIATVEEIQ
jgi:hypothetical protein